MDKSNSYGHYNLYIYIYLLALKIWVNPYAHLTHKMHVFINLLGPFTNQNIGV